MVDERAEEKRFYEDCWHLTSPQQRVPDFWRFYASNKDSNGIPYYEAAQGIDLMTPDFNWLDVLAYTRILN